MKCAGCMKPFEAGDKLIKAPTSEFMGREDDGLDDLMADLLGGSGGKIAYCEACTQRGGRWQLETFQDGSET